MGIKEHRLLLFMKLYQEEFGITLTRDQAHEKATQLLDYTRRYMTPLAKNDEDEIITMSDVHE